MSEVETLKRELKELQNRKNYYINVRDNAKGDREEAKRRRDRIKELNNDLKRDFDGNARDVNKAMNKIESEISKGIKGNNVAYGIANTIDSDQEQEPEYDMDLKNAISNLTDEYNELDNYYQNKKSEASNAQTQINSLTWQITQKNAELTRAKAKALFEG